LRLGLSQLHGLISVVGDSLFSVWEPVAMVQYPASPVVPVDGGGGDGGDAIHGNNTGP
jgi:hypothetical protein